MEICKVPTLLKALNKHSITRIMYIKMEMLSAIKNIKNTYTEKLTHKVDKIVLFLWGSYGKQPTQPESSTVFHLVFTQQK